MGPNGQPASSVPSGPSGGGEKNTARDAKGRRGGEANGRRGAGKSKKGPGKGQNDSNVKVDAAVLDTAATATSTAEKKPRKKQRENKKKRLRNDNDAEQQKQHDEVIYVPRLAIANAADAHAADRDDPSRTVRKDDDWVSDASPFFGDSTPVSENRSSGTAVHRDFPKIDVMNESLLASVEESIRRDREQHPLPESTDGVEDDHERLAVDPIREEPTRRDQREQHPLPEMYRGGNGMVPKVLKRPPHASRGAETGVQEGSRSSTGGHTTSTSSRPPPASNTDGSSGKLGAPEAAATTATGGGDASLHAALDRAVADQKQPAKKPEKQTITKADAKRKDRESFRERADRRVRRFKADFFREWERRVEYMYQIPEKQSMLQEEKYMDEYLSKLAQKQQLQPQRKSAMSNAFQKIKQAVKNVFGDNATVEKFGSIVNGCATNTSDYDCGIRFENDEEGLKAIFEQDAGGKRELADARSAKGSGKRVRAGNELAVAALRRLKEEVQKDPLCIKSQVIESAKVPIIQVEFKAKDAEKYKPSCFDISITTQMWTYDNSRLLYLYLHLHPEKIVRHLAVLLKEYVKVQELGSAKTQMLSSYSYLLMLVHYLQVLEVLPRLQNPKWLFDQVRSTRSGCSSTVEGGGAGGNREWEDEVEVDVGEDVEGGTSTEAGAKKTLLKNVAKPGVHGSTYRFFDFDRAHRIAHQMPCDEKALERPLNPKNGPDFVAEFGLKRLANSSSSQQEKNAFHPNLLALFRGFLRYYADVWGGGGGGGDKNGDIVRKSMLSVKAVRIKNEFKKLYYEEASTSATSATTDAMKLKAREEDRMIPVADEENSVAEDKNDGKKGNNAEASWESGPPEAKVIEIEKRMEEIEIAKRLGDDGFAAHLEAELEAKFAAECDEAQEGRDLLLAKRLQEQENSKQRFLLQKQTEQDLNNFIFKNAKRKGLGRKLFDITHLEDDFCPPKSLGNDWWFMIEDPIQPDRLLGVNRYSWDWLQWQFSHDADTLGKKDLQVKHLEKLFKKPWADVCGEC